MIIEVLLLLAGLLAGFIDSIAGGGGLVTVPIFSILLGPGATAIGTNKIVAVVASGAALLIYLRGGHVSLKGNRRFAGFAAVGALAGSLVSPLVPAIAYKWIIVSIAPLVLWMIFNKDWWVKKSLEAHDPVTASKTALWLSGFAIGVYDGLAGPGGGTMMFLSLLVFAKLPLLQAMATTKVANLSTAAVALGSFAWSGHVVWTTGLTMGLGIGVGAMLGAHLASRQERAAMYARTALLVVVTLLLVRLIVI
jgi:uncharacterized protein